MIGQIYVPTANWILLVGCIALVLGFRQSAGLAGAYGVAVAGTMLITTILFTVVVHERFHWPTTLVIPMSTAFLIVDLAFFTATLAKIAHGGWVPLLIGVVAFTLMSTWRTGKRIVRERTVRRGLPLREFVASLAKHPPPRTPGTGIYLFATPGVTPPVLLATLKHMDSLHEQVVVLTIESERRPQVPPAMRCRLTELGEGFAEIALRYGFLEDPDIARAISEHAVMKLALDPTNVSYFVGRESLRVTPKPGMAPWREHLYTLMSRNAADPAEYFNLPPDHVIEVATVVEL